MMIKKLLVVGVSMLPLLGFSQSIYKLPKMSFIQRAGETVTDIEFKNKLKDDKRLAKLASKGKLINDKVNSSSEVENIKNKKQIKFSDSKDKEEIDLVGSNKLKNKNEQVGRNYELRNTRKKQVQDTDWDAKIYKPRIRDKVTSKDG